MSNGIVDLETDLNNSPNVFSRSSSSDVDTRHGSGGALADGSTSGQISMRLESLQQENRVLRMELETIRCKCKGLEEENRELKKSRVDIVGSKSCCFQVHHDNHIY